MNDPNRKQEPEILVNQNQETLDPTVVVDESNRTVVLTENDTIVIEKPMHVEVVPSNRPRKVYSGMWGPMEIASFAVSLFVLLGAFALYLFFVAPSNRKLEETKAERDGLEQELISARSKYGDISNTETQVSKLVTSISNFESTYLPIASNGQTALYQRLNGLIAAYSLTNTNGPNYAPLALNEGQNQNGDQSDQERGRSKFKSIFPGVYVTMTVEGSYQNLRRFINDIETSNEFVIISSVELEPTETKKQRQTGDQQPAQEQPQQQYNSPFGSNTMRGFDPRGPMPRPQTQPVQQQPQVEIPKGKTHGETVSLRLEMAAYFRRANFVPVTEEAAQ
jgi:hypothetical protein